MITEIVMFRLPERMSRDDALVKYRLSIPIWQANPDLIRKAFLFDEASRQGGGVYLWKNVEAAKLATVRHFRNGSGPPLEQTLNFNPNRQLDTAGDRRSSLKPRQQSTAPG